ncbi:MAG: 2-dehydropantoate 2-reductase N-terminal domain-containing protein, partial [Sulfuricaulis sp.]|nr:2-dehydropantoate 2-reductase N-terminal domain-containing protein [Sulfuricaulis sp.]
MFRVACRQAVEDPMKITIYGAGAIGGCVGAYMARAGVDVLLVDKMTEHVDAMNASGLAITGINDFKVRVRASTPAELRGPLGLVFLAVKSYDTDAALDVLAPLCGPDTVVVSLQNGMNAPRIAARIGAERVVDAFVSLAADWHAPGHIQHGATGNIWIGEIDGRITERLTPIQQLLAHAVTTHITDNITGYLWSKQVDCSLLFAQAVSDETYADLFSNARYQPALIALVGEGVRMALAAGIRLQGFDGFEPLKMLPQNA